jgi:hypothetical protein
MLTNVIDMRPCKLAAPSCYNFLPLLFNSQAIDSFLQSPQGHDIKHLMLFDKEWEVLLDIAHVLKVQSRM